MSRAAVADPRVTPTKAALWLYEAGTGLKAVETDEGLARHLADALIRERIRLSREPADYAAVRSELHRLWGESERKGRSAECARYATPSQRT